MTPEKRQKRIEYMRAYNKKIKKRRHLYNIARRKENVEWMREYRKTDKWKTYIKQYATKNKEHHAEYAREYRKLHPDKQKASDQRYNTKHKTEKALRHKRYCQTHRDKIREISLRRTANKSNTYIDLTKEDREHILSFGCFFCGTHEDLAIAHDIAVSKKGNTTRGNCFCLCRSCNSKMKAHPLCEMISQLELPIE